MKWIILHAISYLESICKYNCILPLPNINPRVRIYPHHHGEQDCGHKARDQHKHQAQQPSLAETTRCVQIAVVDRLAINQRRQSREKSFAQLNIGIHRAQLWTQSSILEEYWPNSEIRIIKKY